MFKDKLYSISKDLQTHHRDRDLLFSTAVKERLDKSLVSYMDEITKSCEYLCGRQEVGILRRMNKRI